MTERNIWWENWYVKYMSSFCVRIFSPITKRIHSAEHAFYMEPVTVFTLFLKEYVHNWLFIYKISAVDILITDHDMVTFWQPLKSSWFVLSWSWAYQVLAYRINLYFTINIRCNWPKRGTHQLGSQWIYDWKCKNVKIKMRKVTAVAL